MDEIPRLELVNLPNEILSTIIREVDLKRFDAFHLRPPKLNALSLMLCSRQLHALAEPILYSHVSLKSPSSLPLFLCKLLARPELAQRLQTVHTVVLGQRLNTSALSHEDRNSISEAIRRVAASIEEASKWIRATENGSWDAFMALLLTVSPNIYDLKLGQFGGEMWGPPYDYSFTFEVCKRAVALQNCDEVSPLALSRLRKFSIEAWNQESRYSVETITPLLALRSISSVNLAGLYEVSTNPPHPDFEPFTSAARNLSIYICPMEHHLMEHFLSSFTSLERLYYCHDHYSHGALILEPPRMMPALHHLKSTLKELTILDGNPYGDDATAYCPIGSFDSFPKLTRLCTFASILMGDGTTDSSDGFNRSQRLVDAVPPTLESLTLKNCGENCVSNLFELVLQKERRTPHFESLDLEWKVIRYPDGQLSPAGAILHPGFTKEQADGLTRACDTAGITIKLHALSPPSKTVVYRVPPAPDLGSSRIVTEQFPYPYDGYEESCREHGCDLATGKLLGAGKYPLTHADFFPAVAFE